jgi:Ca2+-binding EF-hand superfamily protein
MVDTVLELLNKIRTNPVSCQKELTTIAKALKRSKKSAVGEELEKFVSTFDKIGASGELILSEGLSKGCNEEIGHTMREQMKIVHREYEDVKDHVQKYCTSYSSLVMLLDKGPVESILTRLLISDYDPNRDCRKSLFNKTYKYVGIATRPVEDDDNVTIIILADFVEEIESDEYKFRYKDLKDLEIAFDYFDVNRTGKVEPKELKQALRILGYDQKNPTIFEIINKLDTKENEHGVDFRTFAIAFDQTLADDRTKDGLYKIFTLFIDDPHQFILNEASIRKLCLNIDEKLNEGEAREILERAALDGNDLEFEEFYEIMTTHVV